MFDFLLRLCFQLLLKLLYVSSIAKQNDRETKCRTMQDNNEGDSHYHHDCLARVSAGNDICQ